jgi:hypothetical protein
LPSQLRTETINARGQAWVVFIAFLLAFLRAPRLLLHGRVFAEEGTVYLQQAWNAPAMATMLAVRQGYYSLLMNTFALLASRVIPLEYVAVLSTWMALCILLLTVYLAAICESFTSGKMRILAAALILFGPPVEVWMTLLDAQFYLPICVALICISDETRHRAVRYMSLVIAGLTGPASCALTPFFWLKAYRSRTAGAMVQATILTVLSIFQGTILLRNIHSGDRIFDVAGKLEWLGPIFFTKTFCLLLLTRVGVFGSQRLLSHHPNFVVAAALWVLFAACVALYGKASLLFNYAGDPAPASVIFTGEFRYFFSGEVLFTLAVLMGYQQNVGGAEQTNHRLAGLLLGLALLSGIVDAGAYWARAQGQEPRWSDQVATWRKDRATPIRVYPADWSQQITLRPR